MTFVVFSVDQADRMTLMGPPKEGSAPNLKPVELSFVECPQQGRRLASGDFTADEPFAAEAVELIRNKFIGRPVRFKEDYFIEPLQRSAGRLTLVDDPRVDAACLLLEEGLGAVPAKIPQGMDPALHKRYWSLMKVAFRQQKGLFAPEKEQGKHVRHMLNLPADQLSALIKEVEGQDLRVRVERAISGTALVLMAKDPFGDAQIPVHLTGVGLKGLEESMSSAAKFFTERYLLHRVVTARVDGVDSFGNVLVSIVSAKGSFQEELLRQGLCKLVPATATMSLQVDQLMAAEQQAKDDRKGIWKNYVPPASAVTTVSAAPAEEETVEEGGAEGGEAGAGGAAKPVKRAGGVPTFTSDGQPGPAYTGPTHFTGKLVQVIHADTLVIRDDETNQQIRVNLAGLRCSKAVTRDQDGNSPETRVTYSEYSWEAREFVRSRYIGWRVTVHVEYARVIPETKELRPAAVVINAETGVNIGAALLEAGLATFFLGRNGTCYCAGEYQAAEAGAKAAGLGVHSGEDVLPTKVLELSHLGESRSRYYLSFFQRGMQGNRPPVMRGVVDVVISGNSVRVHIPKEHFQIPVRLAGIIAPANPPGAKPDRFFDEARNFVVDLLQQREVNLQVFSSDRAGNFIAAISLDDGTNVSVAIVKAGLATMGNADRLPFVHQLEDAEMEAKAAKRCVWSEAETLPQRAARMESKKAAKGGAFIPVSGADAQFQSYIRTEVGEDGLSVFLQPATEETEETKETIQEMIDTLIQSTNADPCRPSVGQIVAVQYKADNGWHRGKVLRLTHHDGEHVAQVQFIDFGNTQLTPFKCIRSIPRLQDYTFLLDTPAQAFHARLAFLKPRLPPEAMQLSYDLTYEYTDNPLMARAEYKDPSGVVYYTVTWSENEASLSEELLQSGAAFLDKKAALACPQSYERHAAANAIAKKSHVGIWAYGDADDDDE